MLTLSCVRTHEFQARQHAEHVLQENLHVGAIRFRQAWFRGLVSIVQGQLLCCFGEPHKVGFQQHISLVELARSGDETHRAIPEILLAVMALQARPYRIPSLM